MNLSRKLTRLKLPTKGGISMRKKILVAIACVLASLAVLCHVYVPDHEINNTIAEVQNIV